MNMFLKNRSLQVGEAGRDGRLGSAVQIKTKSLEKKDENKRVVIIPDHCEEEPNGKITDKM